MVAFRFWPRKLHLSLLLLVTVGALSGCAHTRSEIAGTLSDYWEWRAEKARYREAEQAHARMEKAKARAFCEPQGTIEESVVSDYTITMEKGMEIESLGLDFKEIEKLKALQEEYDKEYENAMKAYAKLQADAERKRLANYMAEAQAHANGTDGCAPTPHCALPPEQEEALAPPPKRQAVGMEDVPIVIRARYSLSPRQTSYARSEVQRKFLPGKVPCQPCCPDECCDQNCVPTTPCTQPPAMSAPPANTEPASAPASEVQLRRGGTPELVDPFKSRSNGYDAIGARPAEEDSIQPILLSFEESPRATD